MKISILIAAYHAGRFLGKALETIHLQRWEDWELIVVEDGSQDETQELVENFSTTVSQPVRYESLGAHSGVSVARNRLMELAEGDAFAFLDADDWWSPVHLEVLSGQFEKGADVVVTRTEIYDLEADHPLSIFTPPDQLFRHPVRALFDKSCIMTSSSVALSRAITQQVGWFDPAFQIGEDRDYWLRCALAGGRFSDSGHVTCTYAKHGASTMSRTLLWAEQEAAFYEKYASLGGVPAGLRRDRLAICLLNLGRLLRARNPAASTVAIWRAWRLAPWRLRLFSHLLFSAGSIPLRTNPTPTGVES